MQAITFNQYGDPSKVIKVQDQPIPEPKGDEVLIEVKATAVNDYDWSLVRGKPVLYRLMFGLFKPKKNALGMEVSGRVVATGPEVTRLNIGDRVYGDTSDVGFGTYMDYCCLSEKAFTLLPEHINFVDAAATPHAGLLAFQAIQKFNFHKNHKVLINGAGGGVGSFAVQLLKPHGCHITGVDTGEKLIELRQEGYDEVIDYKTMNFTNNINSYDFVLDCKSYHSYFAYRRCLKPDGQFVTVGGQLWTLIRILFWSKLLPKRQGKYLWILGLKPNKGLETIHQMYAEGLLKPKIDGPYPLADAAKHIARFGAGLHAGKIILTPETKKADPQ